MIDTEELAGSAVRLAYGKIMLTLDKNLAAPEFSRRSARAALTMAMHEADERIEAGE